MEFPAFCKSSIEEIIKGMGKVHLELAFLLKNPANTNRIPEHRYHSFSNHLEFDTGESSDLISQLWKQDNAFQP
jgi:hypothetical protein